jgi:hypothetical protein
MAVRLVHVSMTLRSAFFRRTITTHRQVKRVNEDSILAIQIFDQKKFKKKDQGFLGVINVRIGEPRGYRSIFSDPE